MYKLTFLLLAVAASALAIEMNWDSEVDQQMKKFNEVSRKGKTTYRFIGGKISDEIEAKSFTVTGLDSLKRTGHCIKDLEGKTTTYDYHFGFGLLVATFPNLIIRGNHMSAFIRVKNNSVHLKFTETHGHHCYVAIDTFQVEEFSGIEFGASRPEFEGSEIKNSLQKNIISHLNSKIQSTKHIFEKRLTNDACRPHVSNGFFLQEFFNNL